MTWWKKKDSAIFFVKKNNQQKHSSQAKPKDFKNIPKPILTTKYPPSHNFLDTLCLSFKMLCIHIETY